MKTIKSITMLAMVMSLMTVATVSVMAQSVQSDFDRSFRFSDLKTFSFAARNRAATDPLARVVS